MWCLAAMPARRGRKGCMMNDANLSGGATLLSMSPVSRGRKSKKQKRVQKSRQRSARAAVQREDTLVDLLAADSQPGQPSSGFRALAALVDQLAGPRERPAWFGPSIGRMLRQQDAVIAATCPRELEQAVAELAGAEVYWALNEAKRGLWFEWWFEELVQAAADRVKAEAAENGDGWQAPWRLLHGLAAIGSGASRFRPATGGPARPSRRRCRGRGGWRGTGCRRNRATHLPGTARSATRRSTPGSRAVSNPSPVQGGR